MLILTKERDTNVTNAMTINMSSQGMGLVWGIGSYFVFDINIFFEFFSVLLILYS